jgi:hypothetical protein
MAANGGVQPHHVVLWQKQELDARPGAGSSRRVREAQGAAALQAQLYQQIGQRKVEFDWLKNNVGRSA